MFQFFNTFHPFLFSYHRWLNFFTCFLFFSLLFTSNIIFSPSLPFWCAFVTYAFLDTYLNASSFLRPYFTLSCIYPSLLFGSDLFPFSHPVSFLHTWLPLLPSSVSYLFSSFLHRPSLPPCRLPSPSLPSFVVAALLWVVFRATWMGACRPNSGRSIQPNRRKELGS